MADKTLNSIREERLKKVQKLREMDVDPYPASFDKTQTVAQAVKMEGEEVSVAGRIMSLRTHGAISFADLMDETGKIQLFLKKGEMGDSFKLIELLDVGDIVGAEGEVVKTEAGQISVAPKKLVLLAKSIRPLPSQWYGLKDVEERFRKRYLDMIMSPEVRARFNARTKIVKELRNYLDSLGFWEVETPVLHPLYGGANAKPFKTHLNALDTDPYLRIAFELYLKRLIVAGYDKVYEIGRDFRNEGMDLSHNPEFTMVEWYEAYADYRRMMDVTEGLFKHLAKSLNGDTKVKVGEKEIDLGGTWRRATMEEILKEKIGLNVEKQTAESLAKYAKENGIEIVGGESRGQLIFIIFEHKIPPLLVEPIWVMDYPKEVSPLSKDHRTKKGWVERFEGYIGGVEICDGWSELTDPVVQRKRFEEDVNLTRKDKSEAQQVDEDFLEAMEYGMPPLGGIGIGIERLTMFFTNTWSIKEVILFPTMRPEGK